MTVKKLLLAFMVLIGINYGAFAQVASYGFTALSGTFDTLVGGTHVSSIEGDTKISSGLSIGFPFQYEGVTYNTLKATSDGFVTFNNSIVTTSNHTNNLDGVTASKRPLIAPFWDDLDGSANGLGSYASYKTTGTAPNRVFTFEWKRWEWNYSSSSPVITFQVKLFETSNVIEFHYKQEAGSINSGSASIGLTGTSTFLSLSGSGASPTTSSTVETSNINSKPATGQVYRFTPPTCLTPSALTASNVTTTTATLGWTSAGASSYEVELVAASATPTGSGTIVTNNSYNATSLSSGTGYKFYVRKICGANDTSNWAGPYGFSTTYVAPYTEDFESLSDGDKGSMANGWKGTPATGYAWEVNVGGTTTSSTGPSGDHTTGSGKYVYVESTPLGTFAYLESPEIDVTPLNTPELKFWYHRYGSSFETGYIEVDTNGSWFVVDSIVGETQSSNGQAYKEKKILLTGYTGIIKVRFKSERDSYRGDWAIDDFSIVEAPTCLEPTMLNVSSVTATTATLGWTSAGASSYEVEVVTASGTPTGSGTVTSSNPYTATSLTGGTAYKYYVRKICTAGDSSTWAGPYPFFTAYAAPYTEDFESLSDGDKGVLSNGWKGTPSTGYAWEVNVGTTGTGSTGPNGDHTTGSGKYIYTEASYGSNGDIAYLETPSVDLSGLSIPKMEFWYHRYGTDFATGYIEMDTNGTWFVVDSIVGETQTSNSAAYLKKVISLAGYTGIVKARFVSKRDNASLSWKGDWAIDDFVIKESPVLDMAASALTRPVNGCYTSSDTVTVTVKNFGAQTINFATNNLNVGVLISNAVTQTLTTQVTTGTLAAGATMTVNVSNSFNMSTAGTYDFKAYINVTGDPDATNDTASVVSRTVLPLATIPSSVDFTGFNTTNLTTLFPDWREAVGVVPTGTSSQWRGSSSAQTNGFGTKTAKVNLYSNNTNAWIVGPKFIPSATDSIYFKVGISNYNSFTPDNMGSDDRFDVMLSADCGNSWTSIKTFNQANTTNLDTVLKQFSISLDLWAGQQVIVGFRASDGTVDDSEDYDLHLDDIYLGRLVGNDLMVDTILEPNAAHCQKDSVSVKVIVKNQGQIAQSNFDVKVDFTGGAISSLTKTIAGPLAPGAADTIVVGKVFASWAVPLNMKAYTSFAADQIHANDSATKSITINSIPGVNLADDTICTGETVTLDAGAGNTYVWSTGATSQTITVNTPGVVHVTVTNTAGCQAVDSAKITQFAAPTVDLGNDTSYCAGTAFSSTLDATNAGATYKWNDNSTGATLNVTTQGTYFVEAKVGNNCSAKDTIVITEEALPVVNLGNDTTIRDGSPFTVDAGAGFKSYKWQDNSTKQTYKATTTQTVIVEVENNAGCKAKDTIEVTIWPVGVEEVTEAQFQLFPNPNRGEFNIVNGGEASTISIEVINIGGQLVHTEKAQVVTGAQHQMDVTSLAKGLYFINVKAGDKTQQFKMIIE